MVKIPDQTYPEGVRPGHGFAQRLGSVGGAVIPLVADREFRNVLQIYGKPVTWLRRVSNATCSCYDPTYQSPRRGCELCQGTGRIGGYISTTISALIQFDPRGSQYQRMRTQAGPVETLEGTMYVHGSYWHDESDPDQNQGIKNDDLLIWASQEFRVIKVLPRLGSFDRPIFLRLDVQRSPSPLSEEELKRFV